MGRKKTDKKRILSSIEEYLSESAANDDDVPTLAGMAYYLGMSKDELLKLERSSDKEIKAAFISAKNRIEHYFISRAALKKISSQTAHFYLNSVFGYADSGESDFPEDFEVRVRVDE